MVIVTRCLFTNVKIEDVKNAISNTEIMNTYFMSAFVYIENIESTNRNEVGAAMELLCSCNVDLQK